jgi:hypothetical protein
MGIPQKIEKVCICVNGELRYRQSAYHLLLKIEKPYLKVFEEINNAIAQAYPWLLQECQRQIQI